jgi:hypothetical protein
MKDIEAMTIEEIQTELRSHSPFTAADVVQGEDQQERRQRLWLSLDALTCGKVTDAAQVTSDDRKWEHNCWCGEFGSFGYGVSLLKGKEGTWYCAKHRPDALDEAAE